MRKSLAGFLCGLGVLFAGCTTTQSRFVNNRYVGEEKVVDGGKTLSGLGRTVFRGSLAGLIMEAAGEHSSKRLQGRITEARMYGMQRQIDELHAYGLGRASDIAPYDEPLFFACNSCEDTNRDGTISQSEIFGRKEIFTSGEKITFVAVVPGCNGDINFALYDKNGMRIGTTKNVPKMGTQAVYSISPSFSSSDLYLGVWVANGNIINKTSVYVR